MSAADLATENVRLRRELTAAQTLAADYLKNAERAAARAAEKISTLQHALDTAGRHQHDNAGLRGELNRLRADEDAAGHTLELSRQAQAELRATIDRMMSAAEKFGDHGTILAVRHAMETGQ